VVNQDGEVISDDTQWLANPSLKLSSARGSVIEQGEKGLPQGMCKGGLAVLWPPHRKLTLRPLVILRRHISELGSCLSRHRRSGSFQRS
jgi:hypothetical protein